MIQFRKSKKVGPFRFTLGERGLSSSIGGGPFRIGIGPQRRRAGTHQVARRDGAPSLLVVCGAAVDRMRSTDDLGDAVVTIKPLAGAPRQRGTGVGVSEACHSDPETRAVECRPVT